MILGNQENSIMSSTLTTTGDFGGNRPIDPGCWRRMGRGKSVEVELSAHHLVSILSTEAERQHADWKLIVCQKVLRNGRYRQVTEVLPVGELAAYVERGFWQYFLWSPSISPEIKCILEDKVSESTLSILGLINIQCGRQGPGAAKTAFGLVDKIQHVVTGSQVVREQYVSILNRLRQEISKALKSD